MHRINYQKICWNTQCSYFTKVVYNFQLDIGVFITKTSSHPYTTPESFHFNRIIFGRFFATPHGDVCQRLNSDYIIHTALLYSYTPYHYKKTATQALNETVFRSIACSDAITLLTHINMAVTLINNIFLSNLPLKFPHVEHCFLITLILFLILQYDS